MAFLFVCIYYFPWNKIYVESSKVALREYSITTCGVNAICVCICTQINFIALNNSSLECVCDSTLWGGFKQEVEETGAICPCLKRIKLFLEFSDACNTLDLQKWHPFPLRIKLTPGRKITLPHVTSR